MVWLLALIGAWAGATLDMGLLVGAALGALLGLVLQLGQKVDRLERQLKDAAPAPASSSASVPAPATPTPLAPAPVLAPLGVRSAPPPPIMGSDAPPSRATSRPQPPAWWRFLRGWLTEGNLPAKAGVAVLLLAVAATLNYVAQAGYLSISMRLAGLAALGLGALAWGWRTASVRPQLGLALQGGGYGALLLTLFAAHARFGLLPALPALFASAVLIAAVVVLALRQGSPVLAGLGLAGGYLAPVMIHTGSTSPAALFGFYALLNAAVFAIAWKRYWRWMDLMGFAFTFIVGLSWAARYYRPDLFHQVQPFLALFFAFYASVPLVHAATGRPRRPRLETTLLFGTPLLAFPIQAALLEGNAWALAAAALFASAFYSAQCLWACRNPRMAAFKGPTLGLAIAFSTMAVPLVLSGTWTIVAWALEGLALAWTGLVRRRELPRLAGLVLLAMAAVSWIVEKWGHAGPPLFNGLVLSLVVWCVAVFLSAWRHHRHGRSIWANVLVLASLAAWVVFLGGNELEDGVKQGLWLPWLSTLSTAMGAWLALTALILGGVRRPLDWPGLSRFQALAVLGSTFALAVNLLARGDHPFEPEMAMWWPIVATLFTSVALARPPVDAPLGWSRLLAWSAAGLLVSAGTARAMTQAGVGTDWAWLVSLLPWAGLAWAAINRPTLLSFPLRAPATDGDSDWPERTGMVAGCALFALLVWGMWLPGTDKGLPYLPVLSPVDAGVLGLLLATAAWLRRHADPEVVRVAWVAWGALAWLAVSLAAARVVHHYAPAPWSMDLVSDARVQALWSVVWGLAGVVAWVGGSRRGHRPLWLAGAWLMGLVVAKLVLVDWQNLGTLPGIAAFVGVGVLLVAIGRLAPSPPARPA